MTSYGLLLPHFGEEADREKLLKGAKRAEELGFDSVWTAEAYGSDAITPLAYIAAKTNRIRLGTGVIQIAGRTAAMCAMQAQTVDAMAGGNRFIAGLGVSGPQIVEGWYGEPWGNPYYRLRDYMQIMRKVFDRDRPVTHDGREIKLLYATQVQVAPPTIAVFGNHPELLEEHYVRYLHNGFREAWGFTGTPLRVVLRRRAA